MRNTILTIAAVLTLMSCSIDNTETMLMQEIDKGYLNGRNVEVLSYTATDSSTKSLLNIDYYEDTVTELEMERDKAKQRGYTGAWRKYQKMYRKYSKSLDSLSDIAREYPITKRYEVLIKVDDSIEDTYYIYKR